MQKYGNSKIQKCQKKKYQKCFKNKYQKYLKEQKVFKKWKHRKKNISCSLFFFLLLKKQRKYIFNKVLFFFRERMINQMRIVEIAQAFMIDFRKKQNLVFLKCG